MTLDVVYYLIYTTSDSFRLKTSLSFRDTTGYYAGGTAANYGNDACYRTDVWTKKNGIKDMKSLLGTPGVQDDIMYTLLSKNYKTLISAGLIDPLNPTYHVAGMLCVAHLLGVDGAITWAQSGVGFTANGERGDEYYAQGKYMIEAGIIYG